MSPAPLDAGTVVGDRLKRARQEKRQSLRQIAERAGVGRSTLSRWERGQSVPSKHQLRRLCTVLGVDPSPAEECGLTILNGSEDLSRSVRSRRRLLRAIRRRSGLTLGPAAERIGVSKATLSRWEAGDRWPGRERLAEAARALGATDREVEAILATEPLSAFLSAGSESVEHQLETLRARIPTGRARDLDLDFLGLDEAVAVSGDRDNARLRLELRAAYIEWLGWWYRDEEAGLLACKLVRHFEQNPGASVWGRVLRAASNYHTELKDDPIASLELLESALNHLRCRPSEGFVLRELTGIVHGIGDSDHALELLRRAREARSGEESDDTHRFCCDMIEASIWSSRGRHDRAVAELPIPVATDLYLTATSAMGRAKILEGAGHGDEARKGLSSALDEVSAHGLVHFERGLKRRLDQLQ